jgi:hypothetical protein
MRKAITATCSVLLLATVVWAAKVNVDYDSEVDFSKIKTFMFVNTPESSIEKNNPLMHGRMIAIIEQTLTDAGLQKVDADPDVFVTYHATTEDQSSFTTTGFGYGGWGGRGRRWGGGMGMGSSTTTEHTYTEGTLLVDAWSAETEKLVWRGISSQVLKAKPAKQEKQIQKALAKMVDRWEKIKKKQSE